MVRSYHSYIFNPTCSFGGRIYIIAAQVLFPSFTSALACLMKSKLLNNSSLVSLISLFSVKRKLLLEPRTLVMRSVPLMRAQRYLAQRGCMVWQFSMKVVFTYLQGFSSALNFSSWKKARMSSMGKTKQMAPMQVHRMGSHPTPSLICASKIIYPTALKKRVASTIFIACMLSSPFTFQLMLDLLRRVNLSTQQKMTNPIRIRTHPAGIIEQQRYVNQTDSINSAYFLPMLYLGSSMRAWASRWVKSVLPFDFHLLNSLQRYQGLISQMRGTRNELKKNIMDSSSTTPYSSLQMFPNAKSQTSRVMMAVVKKSPRVYFKPKENSYSLPVRCFSMSVKRCRTKERKNLLKKMMASRVRIVAAVARWLSSMAAGSSGFAFSSFSDYYTAWPLAVRMPQNTPVMAPMKSTVRVHPIINLPVLFQAGQFMFSQMIYFGSGASSIQISSPPSPKYSGNLLLSRLSHFQRKSSLASSLSMTRMTFSQVALSLLMRAICLSCYFVRRASTLLSIRSSSASL